MKTALAIWLIVSWLCAFHDEADGRPIWGRAVFAIVCGAILSFPLWVICWWAGWR